MSSNLKEVENEIVKCMKCGNCQAVCPLYKETRSEAAVARGKIRLAEAVLNNEIDYTGGLAHRFDLCLTCLACVESCPCGVRVDKIVLAARAALTGNRGLSWPHKAAFKALSNPVAMNTGMKAGHLARNIFFKQMDRGMLPRFPSGMELKRVLPVPAAKNLKDMLSENNSVDSPVMRVSFFAGCSANYFYPQAGMALVDILKSHGVEVVFPKSQHCCGTPVVTHGARDTAVEMAKSHVKIFSETGVDAIITICGTCGEAFRHYYPELLEGDPDYEQLARELAAKTYDIAEFLTNVLPLQQDLLGKLNITFTYHEPCHIGRGMGAAGKAEKLLKAIPGAKYVPMKNPYRCCGGAGTFSFEHPQLSVDVLNDKLADIDSTGAETVVTGCGSCRMQLDDGLYRQGMQQQVIHTTELLARSIKNK